MGDDAHVVEMFDVVLTMRLLDMNHMCVALSRQCAERKRDKLSRRFSRAAVAFDEMRKEISNETRQTTLPI